MSTGYPADLEILESAWISLFIFKALEYAWIFQMALKSPWIFAFFQVLFDYHASKTFNDYDCINVSYLKNFNSRGIV